MSNMDCDARDSNDSQNSTVNDRRSILAMNQNGSEFILNGDASQSMGGQLSAFHAPQTVIFERYNSDTDAQVMKREQLLDQCTTMDGSSVQGMANGSRRQSSPKDCEVKRAGSPTSGKSMNIYGPCRICSDRATGKHYGAHSCDGCKGFFRRTVRKSHNYMCRFKNKCVIDRDKRNTCRHCRYAKCLNAGMKPEAVQSERDRIRCTRASVDERSLSRSPPHLMTTSPGDDTSQKLEIPQRTIPIDRQVQPAASGHSLTAAAKHRMCSDSALDMRMRDDPASKGDTNLLIGQLMNAEFVAKQTTNNCAAVHRHATVHCVHQTFVGHKATAGSAQQNSVVLGHSNDQDKAETQEIGIEQHQPNGASTATLEAQAQTVNNCDARATNESSTAHVNAEVTSRPRNNSSGSSSNASNAEPRLASIHDLAEAIKQQLLLLVEWAKALPPFMELHMDDQIALLRAYSASHLLLGVARRSLPFRDVLLLSNDACIPRSHSSLLHDVNHVAFRVLDELVEPMRELQMNDTEYSCLKALLFFNPNAQGLSDRQSVKTTRQNFLAVLQDYTLASSRAMLASQGRRCVDDVRFGNILLLSPPLQAMSQQFVEDLQLASLFGMATFDKLLEELLLSSSDYFSEPFLEDGVDFVANRVNRKAGVGKK